MNHNIIAPKHRVKEYKQQRVSLGSYCIDRNHESCNTEPPKSRMFCVYFSTY